MTKIRNRHKGHEALLTETQHEIIRLEGNINYTIFILITGKPKVMSYTLAMYDFLLPQNFIRVSKSCIVNVNFMEKLDADNKKIYLKDGSEIKISRRRWSEVLGICVKNCYL